MRSLLLWAGLVQSLTYALVTLEKARQRHSGRSAGGPRELHLCSVPLHDQGPTTTSYSTMPKDWHWRQTLARPRLGHGQRKTLIQLYGSYISIDSGTVLLIEDRSKFECALKNGTL